VVAARRSGRPPEPAAEGTGAAGCRLLPRDAGGAECYLEWDRATETEQRLAEKLLAYRLAEAELFEEGKSPRCILFVVPGPRRLATLRRAYDDFQRERARRASGNSVYSLDGSWPLIATSADRLRAEGHLAALWERLDAKTADQLALTDLPVRGDLKPVGLNRTLGRRWRKDDPNFWQRLSPLGAGRPGVSRDEAAILRPAADPEAEAFSARLRQLRDAHLKDARRDAAALTVAARETDLRLPAINGSMDDREDDVEEGPWR